MKLLYLYSNYRADRLERVKKGTFSDNQFYGLLRLPKYGVQSTYGEIEQHFPLKVCAFLRKHILGIHLAHIPIFWTFFRYDVIFHVNSFTSQLLFILFGFRKPKWVLYDYSLVGLLGETKTIKQKLLAYIIRHTAGIITLSKVEADRLVEKFPLLEGKVEFIRYGCDTEYFKPRNLPEQHVILTVGYDPGRDYATLFEATKDLGVKVVVTKSHRTKSMPAVLPAHVEVRAFTDAELLEQYSVSKKIVIPLDTRGGINDAMGCSTLVEAMAMGKAVVASQTFTLESYIANGINGVTVPQRNVGEMKNAISDLLSNDTKRKEMGARAREFMEKECTADKIAKQMAEFFKKI
jgi:glycosyltransferase involved in cell wall biosynthesis